MVRLEAGNGWAGSCEPPAETGGCRGSAEAKQGQQVQKPLAEAELSGAVQGTQLAQDAAAGAAQPMQSDRDGWLDELA